MPRSCVCACYKTERRHQQRTTQYGNCTRQTISTNLKHYLEHYEQAVVKVYEEAEAITCISSMCGAPPGLQLVPLH